MKLNKQAWETLTEDEKMSLSIQIGLSKSSWQAGEIMNRSHYKYLEIKYRAEHFLKMFTEHLENWDRLVPDVTGNQRVVEYLRMCIEKRMKPREVIVELRRSSPITKKALNELIIQQLGGWGKSDKVDHRVLFDLVKEFDRWNNFRILPRIIQEPSAYKRRVKNVHKKHIKNLASIHPLSLAKLLKLYSIKKGPGYYLPILESKEPQLYRVKKTKQSMQVLGDIGFYIFKDKDVAEKYLESIAEYVGKSDRECKDGLDFWPKYREIIKTAINYQEVQKITPTRKYLAMALAKHSFL